MTKTILIFTISSLIATTCILCVNWYNNAYKKWELYYGSSIVVYGYGSPDDVVCSRVSYKNIQPDGNKQNLYLKLEDVVINLGNVNAREFRRLTPTWREELFYGNSKSYMVVVKNANLKYFTSGDGAFYSALIFFNKDYQEKVTSSEVYVSNDGNGWLKFPASMHEVTKAFGEPTKIKRLVSD